MRPMPSSAPRFPSVLVASALRGSMTVFSAGCTCDGDARAYRAFFAGCTAPPSKKQWFRLRVIELRSPVAAAETTERPGISAALSCREFKMLYVTNWPRRTSYSPCLSVQTPNRGRPIIASGNACAARFRMMSGRGGRGSLRSRRRSRAISRSFSRSHVHLLPAIRQKAAAIDDAERVRRCLEPGPIVPFPKSIEQGTATSRRR